MSHPPLPFVAVVVRLFVLRPADPNRASGEGRDGSDPPFCAAGAARRMGWCQPRCQAPCQTPSPPSGGSLPSVCIPAIWTPPSMQGFHPSWKGEIRRSLLAWGRNCASTCRVLTGTGTMTRGDDRLRTYIRPLRWRHPSPGHHDSRTPRATTGNGVTCAGRESASCGVGRFEMPCHLFELSAVVVEVTITRRRMRCRGSRRPRPAGRACWPPRRWPG